MTEFPHYPAPVHNLPPENAMHPSNIMPQHSGSAPDPVRDRVDDTRPFFAHVRTSWWRALLAIIAIAFVVFLAQIALSVIALLVEYFVTKSLIGVDSFALTPILLLATNLGWAVAIPVSLLALRWIGGVPWRAAFRVGRSFSWPALLAWTAVFAVPLIAFYLGTMLLDPAGVPTVSLTGTLIAFVVIIVATTPLQAAGEEITFRGVLAPLVGSWIRPERIAVGVAIATSTLIFAAMHFAGDLWLNAYYVVLSLCLCGMALVTRGLETLMAFHIANNVVTFFFTLPAIEDGGISMDRSAGTGGPWMLIVMAIDILALVAVYFWERHRRARRSPVDHHDANAHATRVEATAVDR